MENLLGYFETWSSSTKYRQATGAHPTEPIKGELAQVRGTLNRSGICTSRYTCASGEYKCYPAKYAEATREMGAH